MLCTDDDDWYEIHLADDERVEVDLTFVDDGPLGPAVMQPPDLSKPIDVNGGS